jgi:tRNA A64-2'-O-ribosylphosphate transferase
MGQELHALQERDLIFPSAASALKDTLGQLQKSNLSIKNRLRSIKQDAEYVCAVADAYHLPLIANERCGSWYIPPNRKAGSAYFKSTDGHSGHWSFSLRRLNLQVLDVLHVYGGCILVDSTRRGKSMPDALSKTIPIWTTVLNRLLYPDMVEAGELRTPLDVVSESEHAQIEARLATLLEETQKLGLDLCEMRVKLNHKPMQVCWQRPGDTLPPPETVSTSECNLIVLCTASNQTSNHTAATSDYVQGAADDPESWSLGLGAATFWKHAADLLMTDEDQLPALILELTENSETNTALAPVLIKPTERIWLGTNKTAGLEYGRFDLVVSCTMSPDATIAAAIKDHYAVLACTSGKRGSRQLRTELAKLDPLHPLLQRSSRVLVTCETGRDLAAGVALALLCRYLCDDGTTVRTAPTADANKTLIKQRLSWIMVSLPDASPSRATLQSVNSFLMG